MRIGLLMPEYPSASGHGGIATYTYVLASALSEEGHQVTLVVKPGTVLDALHPKVRVQSAAPAPLGGLYQRFLRLFLHEIAYERSFSLAARRIFDNLHAKEGLEVVEIPEYNGNAIFFESAPYKVVIRLHTPSYLVDRLNGKKAGWRRRQWYELERSAVKRADGIAAPSQALKKEAAHGWGIPEGRIAVIPYPVDSSAFFPPEKREGGAGLRLLFSGRLEKRKGMDVLVELVGRLFARRQDITLVLAGAESGHEGGHYRRKLTGAAGQHRLLLEFLGARPRHELPELYRGADLFVIPSPFDNAPNSLFEAMASGLPCLGSDTGGINEIIDHGKNGLLFRVGDAGDLMEKVEQLAGNAALRETLGKNAREKMVTVYDPAAVARQMAAYYSGLQK